MSAAFFYLPRNQAFIVHFFLRGSLSWILHFTNVVATLAGATLLRLSSCWWLSPSSVFLWRCCYLPSKRRELPLGAFNVQTT